MSETFSLSAEKQLFLQCIMSRRVVDSIEAQQILRGCIEGVYHCSIFNNESFAESNQEASVDEFIREINSALKPTKMQISKGCDEENEVEYYAFVNLIDSDITRLSSLHSAADYELFKKIISALFNSEDAVLSVNFAINLSFTLLSENKVRVSDAEKLINKWIEQKYFSLTDNDTKIYFGIRSILEMQSYFREFYGSSVVDCNLCNIICIRGILCKKCSAKFHFRCARKCYDSNKHCAQCKDPWAEDFITNTRNSDSNASQRESTESQNRRGKRKRNVRD